MARTPLARMLRQLFAEHRVARRLGLPLAGLRELRERAAAGKPARGGARLTRRQLLAGAAAGALVAALPGGARARRGPRVAIVGAGFGGLSCALELARLGVAATLYDAAGRVGGRVFSARREFDAGQVAEWGGELIDSGHETVLGLAARFELPVDELLAAHPPGAQDTFYFGGGYYAQAEVDADFAPVFEAVVADEASAPFPTLRDAHTPAGAALDRLSVYDWIETRVPGGHGSRLGQLLDVAYTAEYGADTDQQSALNLIYLLAFQPEPGAFAALGESDEALHIRGGNQRLAQAMAAELGVGERVQLGLRLSRIAQTPAGRYRLSLERGGASPELLVDAVVLALPFAVLRELDTRGLVLDARKRRAIERLGRGCVNKLNVQFARRLWNEPGPWPGAAGSGSSYADTGYQSSWDATRAQPGEAGILTLYAGGSAAERTPGAGAFATAAHPQLRRALARALDAAEPVFPGLGKLALGRATQSLPQRSALYRAAYSYYRPGQYTDFAGHEFAPQGGLFFCGEHTSQQFQGFMEGAAESGVRAARALAQRLGARR